jgi:hypothetical protein
MFEIIMEVMTVMIPGACTPQDPHDPQDPQLPNTLIMRSCMSTQIQIAKLVGAPSHLENGRQKRLSLCKSRITVMDLAAFLRVFFGVYH